MALVLRAVKGSPLTIEEMDGNFTHLNERFTALNASNLTSGTVPDARLSSNVVLGSRTITSGSGLSGGGNLSGNLTLTVDGTVIRTTGNQTVGGVKTFTSRMVLNGGTGINSAAGVLVVRQNGNTYTSGVTLTSSHTTFTRIWKDASGTTHISSSNTTGGIEISTTGVVSTVGNLNVGGTLSGNGSSLTSLSASNLGSGTVPTARLSGTYGINITGSAGSASSATTATRLATARTISLTGDLSGSTTFDGSGNVSISASVANNSHSHTWSQISSKPDIIYQSEYGVNRGGSSTNPNTTTHRQILSNHSNSPGKGLYWHITTSWYSSKGGNASQIAVSYNGGTPRIAWRHKYQGAWEGWRYAVDDTSAYATRWPTAAEAGAVPTGRNIATGTGLSGGGNLTANRTLSVDSTVVRQRRIYNSGSQTLSGSGYKKTTWLNWSNSPTITIDGSSFMDGSEIKIVNQKGGGTVTISCNDGSIYIPDGSNSSSHTLSSAGTVHMIKYNSTSWMAQVY